MRTHGRPKRPPEEGWNDKMRGEGKPPTLSPTQTVDVILTGGARYFGVAAGKIRVWGTVTRWRLHESESRLPVEEFLESLAASSGMTIRPYIDRIRGLVTESQSSAPPSRQPTPEETMASMMASPRFAAIARAQAMHRPAPGEEIAVPEPQPDAKPIHDDPDNPWIEKLLGAGRPMGIRFGSRVDVIYSNEERRGDLDPSRDVRDWRSVVRWRLHSDPPAPEGYEEAEPPDTEQVKAEESPSPEELVELLLLRQRVALLSDAVTQIHKASRQDNITRFCSQILVKDRMMTRGE